MYYSGNQDKKVYYWEEWKCYNKEPVIIYLSNQYRFTYTSYSITDSVGSNTIYNVIKNKSVERICSIEKASLFVRIF